MNLSKNIFDVEKVDAVTGGVIHEHRDPRLHNPVKLPFVVVDGERILKGVSFSVAGFEVKADRAEFTDKSTHLGLSLDGHPYTLRIELNGIVVELMLYAKPDARAQDKTTQGYTITRIGEREMSALKRISRAYHAGLTITADDILRPLDTETAYHRASAETGPGRFRRGATWVISTLILLGILSAGIVGIHDRLFVVKSSFATITAPKIDIYSVEAGRIGFIRGGQEPNVTRDEVLFEQESSKLDAAIELSRSRIEYLEASTPSVLEKLGDVAQPVLSSVTPEADPGAQRFSLLQNEILLEEGKLRSYLVQKKDFSDFSPCDCKVVGAQQSGAWLRPGDLVMTLTGTEPSGLRIEALVSAKKSANLKPGATALVRIPDVDDLVEAEIEIVSLDGVSQPRYGFPDWLRKDQSLVSVTLKTKQPLDVSQVSLPVQTYISNSKPLAEWFKTVLN